MKNPLITKLCQGGTIRATGEIINFAMSNVPLIYSLVMVYSVMIKILT